MKKIRTLLMLVAVIIASESCIKEETPHTNADDTPTGWTTDICFNAIGEVMTRTSLDASYNVVWTKGNSVSVFPGGIDGTGYEFTTENGGNTEATFSGSIVNGNGVFYAVYPHVPTASLDDEIVRRVSLPCNQKAVKGSFDNDVNLMMAKTTNSTFEFKNICGLIRIPITREDITAITLTSNDGKALAGTFDIQWNGGDPVVTNITEACDHITISDNGNVLAPGNYFLTVLPGTITGGFKLNYTTISGANAEQIATNDANVQRSRILYIGEPDKKADFNHRILDDFENGGKLIWKAGEGAVFEKVSNPSVNGINNSKTVSRYTTSANAWDYVEASFSKLDLSLGKLIKMHVYSPATGIRIYAKLTSNSGVNKEVQTAVTSSANEWDELVFNFEPLNLENLEYVKLTICADAGGTDAGTEIYFDNIIQCAQESPFVDAEATRLIGDFEGYGILGVHAMSGATWSEAENPEKGGINPSSTVGRYTKSTTAWDGIYTDSFKAFNFTNDGCIIKMQVYAPDAGQTIQLKLEKGSDATYRNIYVNAVTTKANEWEELTFDFGACGMSNSNIAGTLSEAYNKFVIYAYGGNSNASGTHIYFDNIRQVKPQNAFFDINATRCFGGFEYGGLLTVNNSNTKSWSIIENPVAGGINTSAHCGYYEKSANAWDLVYTNPFSDLNFKRDGYKMKMQVYAPHTGMTFQIKLEGNNGSYINYRVNVTNTKVNEWEELTFDFQNNGVSESNPAGTLNDNYWKFCICAYGGAGGYEGTKIYIDNIRQTW